MYQNIEADSLPQSLTTLKLKDRSAKKTKPQQSATDYNKISPFENKSAPPAVTTIVKRNIAPNQSELQ